MAILTPPVTSLNTDTCNEGRDSTSPYRDAAIRELNSFVAYIATHFFGTNKQNSPTPSHTNVDILDISTIEDERAVSSIYYPPFQHKRNLNSLRSPRFMLQNMIPNSSSQRMQLDLLMLQETPTIEALRKFAWKGCSSPNRAEVWRLLLGCEPLDHCTRQSTLERQRRKYREYGSILCAPGNGKDVEVCRQKKRWRAKQKKGGTTAKDESHFEGSGIVEYSDYAMKTLHQIEMDLPRTHPHIPILHVPEVRNPMRRILYLYGMLNPDKNYVQGMNELLAVILVVFLGAYLKGEDAGGVEGFLSRECLTGELSAKEMEDAEADSFRMFERVVGIVGDNFEVGQRGILRRIARLNEIVGKVDKELAAHLDEIGIEYVQFAYRWMNCLLIRELPFALVVKLWDALFAEEDGLPDLHVFVCAAIMVRFREELMKMDFEECIMFLQNMPTKGWKTCDIDISLCQAYVWKKELGLESVTCMANYLDPW